MQGARLEARAIGRAIVLRHGDDAHIWIALRQQNDIRAFIDDYLYDVARKRRAPHLRLATADCLQHDLDILA